MSQPRSNPRVTSLALAALAAGVLALSLCAAVAFGATAAPVISKVGFEANETSATLKATINPGERKTKYRFEYVDQATFEAEGFTNSIKAPEAPGVIPEGTEDVAVEVPIEGLKAATLYHFRVFAENSKGEVTSPELIFATYAAPPSFGPCPNEAFRSGLLAPGSHPSDDLPDCRAYEQASPVDKNGGDATGSVSLVRAAPQGGAVSFLTTSGIPGGDGAQGMPSYLASRGAGGWNSHGLLPPATAGARALVLGWQPDFSQVFSRAAKIGGTPVTGFFSRPGTGGAFTQIAPYTTGQSLYAFVGASADGSSVLFESPADLGTEPPGLEGVLNVYAWDRTSETLHLASVMNDGQSPAKGAFAGYGSANSFYYLQDQHAVSADGSVFFTASAGQLYLRKNPTESQSAMSGETCTEPEKSCTVRVSASHRTPPDPAGTRPAGFMGASVDGSKAFFTSSEELTDDANTGPVQPPAQIGRAKSTGSKAEEVKEDFLSAHALGMTTSPDGKHVYWADPITHFIGRAELNGAGEAKEVESEFIDTGETEAETDYEKPGVFEAAPSTPRYVAVDSKYVYWTNTGPLGQNPQSLPNQPIYGGGTIGRAELSPGGGVGEIKPEFIKGASNPLGIAVNSTHIYWANAEGGHHGTTIVRAEIGGGGVDRKFFQIGDNDLLAGMALSATHLYYGTNTGGDAFGFVSRIPLEGGEDESLGIGKESKIRGVAVDGSRVYWAALGEGKVGRIPFSDLKTGVGGCPAIPSCEDEFVKLSGSPFGLAADGERVYWSVNGETPPNPGNDLYRYEPKADTLTDLTPNSAEVNGAEVKGVLGISDDGSTVYFAANGDLDGPEGAATPGDCHGAQISTLHGNCNLYRWHAGTIGFIAHLKAVGSSEQTDAFNWTGTPKGLLGSIGSYAPKTSFLSEDGQTLVFRSLQKLTAYDNEGVAQFYRYRVGEPLLCLTCNPTGGPSEVASLLSIGPPGAAPFDPAALASRNLSADGERFFFETADRLVASDTDGEESCPRVLLIPICQDVYEWEAPGTGSCKEGGPGFAPMVGGCLYLLSATEEGEPGFFGDASASGDDAFIFTRSQLVGQDGDELLDVYDVRVNGGLGSQNKAPIVPCEGEGCKPGSTPPPSIQSPASFSGPPNPAPKRPKACPKGKRRVKSRCVKRSNKGQRKRGTAHRRGGAK